jgi:RsiW-degrading membrane proteinase PrsW (M82 family)
MTESDSNVVPAETSGGAQAQRLPPLQQLATAVNYMREAANNEFKRAGDTRNAMLLPISCLLLVASICVSCPPQLRAVTFVVPLFCFTYYIANRIGIVRTFNPRQAYLTWHVLIATFLMGGTFALFLVYVGACLMMYASRGSL